MSISTITVTEPHALSVEEVIARLQKLAEQEGGNGVQFKLTDVTASFTVGRAGVSAPGRATITDSQVTIEFMPAFGKRIIEWLGKGWLQDKLKEALK